MSTNLKFERTRMNFWPSCIRTTWLTSEAANCCHFKRVSTFCLLLYRKLECIFIASEPHWIKAHRPVEYRVAWKMVIAARAILQLEMFVEILLVYSSLLHSPVLQDDARKTDRTQRYGKRRFRILQLSSLDKGKHSLSHTGAVNHCLISHSIISYTWHF